MYASETWSMSEADRKRLLATEMWIWRRVKKMDRITNEEVLQRVNKTKTMCGTQWENVNVCGYDVLRHESLLKNEGQGYTR